MKKYQFNFNLCRKSLPLTPTEENYHPTKSGFRIDISLNILTRAMKGYRLFLSGHKKQLFNFRLKHFQTELDKIFYICLKGGNVSILYFPCKKIKTIYVVVAIY